jgi:hypothetical protein
MRRRLLLAFTIAAIVLACGKGPPGGPSGPPPPALKVLTISGPARIAPAGTQQLEAVAQMADGTTQSYTSKVQWLGTNPFVLSLTSGGLLTARAVGEASVFANFGTIRATMNVTVIPTGTYRLAGMVRELGLPLIGATVKVTSGVGASLSTSTDNTGQYRLYGVAGAVEIQVTKAGYTPVTKSINVGADDLLDFPDLVQAASAPQLAGTYTLTLSAADGCRISPRNAPVPAEAKTRTYTAVVTQDGPRLLVTLSGANFLVQNGKGNAFEGRVEPDGVSFNLRTLGGYAYYYYYSYYTGIPDLAEKLSTGDYVAFLGKVSAKSSAAGVTGQLQGTEMLFAVGPTGTTSIRMTCDSNHHQFSLTPQTAATRHRR